MSSLPIENLTDLVKDNLESEHQAETDLEFCERNWILHLTLKSCSSGAGHGALPFFFDSPGINIVINN